MARTLCTAVTDDLRLRHDRLANLIFYDNNFALCSATLLNLSRTSGWIQLGSNGLFNKHYSFQFRSSRNRAVQVRSEGPRNRGVRECSLTANQCTDRIIGAHRLKSKLGSLIDTV